MMAIDEWVSVVGGSDNAGSVVELWHPGRLPGRITEQLFPLKPVHFSRDEEGGPN